MMLCDCVMTAYNSSFTPLSEVYDASLCFLCYVRFVGLPFTLRVCVMHHVFSLLCVVCGSDVDAAIMRDAGAHRNQGGPCTSEERAQQAFRDQALEGQEADL